ncbi:protein kinase [Gemmata sp. JC717]|uniref:serine/threonine protein kinase n=1 Tax=Gemmata algarum TaxID=2975278 RepID=UPI0021BB6F40|nr:serine/threonine-protein kinase [Gemmata algarum]MDY3553072.1 protein kinase [Gemmata algarum]
MAVEPPVPQQLGNYDIVSKIAEGGMGTVYKGRNRATGEVVAVKVIAPATAKNPILLQRFEREFLAAKVLDHPNVVRALDYSGTPPHPFLVMEFVDGQSIGQCIEQQGKYAESEAVRLVAQVCDGLQRAHKQGLVHRDVKPDNILVNKEGVAKLTDMGLVKEVEGDLNLTRTGRGLGTPHYMAPEQFRNAKTVDVRGDIYSLGATLYAMVTGVVPFDNASPLDCWMRKIRNEFRSPKELNPALSDRVDWAIRRAMSAEPAQRPASCREFLEDLTGQSRPSQQNPNQQGQPAPGADVWYLVYRDENEKPHTVKGSTEGIRNALRDSLLGDPSEVLVSRTKNGQFTPLASVPEFRDLVVTPAPVAVPAARTPNPDETVEYREATPPGPSSSGNLGRRPAPKASTAPKPPPYSYNSPSGAYPPPKGSREHKVRVEERAPREEPKPFNWTPLLALVVLILTAIIGYLVLAK